MLARSLLTLSPLYRPAGVMQLRFGSSAAHHGHHDEHHDEHLDEGLDENGKPKPYSIAQGREKRGFLWGEFNPHKDVKLSERNFWIGTFVILGFFTYIMKERPFKEGPTEDARQIIAYRRHLRSQETEE